MPIIMKPAIPSSCWVTEPWVRSFIAGSGGGLDAARLLARPGLHNWFCLHPGRVLDEAAGHLHAVEVVVALRRPLDVAAAIGAGTPARRGRVVARVVVLG